MKLDCKKALCLAIMAASSASIAPQAFAADAEPGLNVSLRTFYFNRDYRDGSENRVAASQALRLDYVSPYYNDFIGFDGSLYNVLKLDGRDNDQGTGALRNKGNDTESYSRIGQAYVKMKLGSVAQVRAGAMSIKTPLLWDNDARSIQSSTEAVMVNANLAGINLYGIYSNRAANQNRTKFDRYTDVDGHHFSIYVGGGDYTFDNGLKLAFAHGDADKFEQSYANVSYPFERDNGDKVLLNASYFYGTDDGTMYGDDYQSSLLNVYGIYTRDNVSLSLSYQNIGGNAGYKYNWDNSDNDNQSLRSRQNVQARAFNDDDEQSLQARIDYKVKSVPGLSFMTRYTQGWDVDVNGQDNQKEGEADFDTVYVLQNGTLKGLSLHARVAHVKRDYAEDIDEFRFIANYSFKAL